MNGTAPTGLPGRPEDQAVLTDFLLTTPFLHHMIQSGLFLGGKELTVCVEGKERTA